MSGIGGDGWANDLLKTTTGAGQRHRSRPGAATRGVFWLRDTDSAFCRTPSRHCGWLASAHEQYGRLSLASFYSAIDLAAMVFNGHGLAKAIAADHSSEFPTSRRFLAVTRC
jgi:hypothetical protein